MSDLGARIETMYRRDVRFAWLMIALLWATIVFVLSMTWPFIPVPAIRFAVLFAAFVVLIFNTAAILSMVRHYAEDKEFIYGTDIQNLDAARERKLNS